MIAAPPFDSGALHERVTRSNPADDRNERGADGAEGTNGVAVATFEGSLTPIAFTARTRNQWSEPFDNGVTTVEVAVDTASSNVFHVAPLLLDHSTT